MKPKVLMLLSLLLGISLLSALDMYGAFQIITTPKRADVTLYDIDLYLCSTPSQAYLVTEEEGMEIREGIPGRAITLMITKDGFVPLKKQIFVPFTYADEEYALDNPTVFSFDLKRDRRRSYALTCYYYSYHNPRPRWHYHLWSPGFYPWCPPGFVFNPGGNHHAGGGHNGGFDPGMDNPPDGGHHGDGDNHPGDGDNPPGTHYGTLFTTSPLNSDELNHKEKLPGPGGRSKSPDGPGRDSGSVDKVTIPRTERPVIVVDEDTPSRQEQEKPEVKPDKKDRSDDSKKTLKTESEKEKEKAHKKDKDKTQVKDDDKKEETKTARNTRN